MDSEKHAALSKYNACDISDALLKLKVPNAGFLPDIVPFPPNTDTARRTVIAPASTVLFAPKNAPDSAPSNSSLPPSNIPSDAHYVDLTRTATIVILSQPEGQTCAILGGIMVERMKMRGAQGVVVLGRARDAQEIAKTDFPVWSREQSTVGAGAQAKPWTLDGEIQYMGTRIQPVKDDIVFADPNEGVVVIPSGKLDEVIELLPRITKADDKVMEEVRNGGTVQEAFAKHRRNL